MPKYQAPTGMTVRGWIVALEPSPEQVASFRRDCGARRFAYNWAVTTISESFEAGKETGDYDSAVWSAYSLRKRWNRAKNDIAPWWAENSKESYAGGIADAVTGLKNWHDSKTGKRQGPKVKFPRRKKKTRDRLRCTYTTGALRADGSRMVVLPGVGQVRTAENIRPLWRHVRRGTARLLSATIREKAGRWVVSLRVEITAPRQPAPSTSTVGADVGIGNHLLIAMHPDPGASQGESHQPESVAGSSSRTSGAQTRRSPANKKAHHAGVSPSAGWPVPRRGPRTSVPTRSTRRQLTWLKPTARWSSRISRSGSSCAASGRTASPGRMRRPVRCAGSSPTRPVGTAAAWWSRTAGTRPAKPAPRAGR